MDHPFEGIPTVPPRKDMTHMVCGAGDHSTPRMQRAYGVCAGVFLWRLQVQGHCRPFLASGPGRQCVTAGCVATAAGNADSNKLPRSSRRSGQAAFSGPISQRASATRQACSSGAIWCACC